MRCTRALLVFAALALNSGRSEEKTAEGAQKPDSNSVSQSASPRDSTALQLIKKVKPEYPLAALPEKLQGQVIVKIVVSETGDVESADIVSGNPVLARSALDAVKKWKFNPVVKNGKTAKASTQLTFDFAYSENVKDIQPPPTAASKPEPRKDADKVSNAIAPAPGIALPQRVRVSAGVTQGLVLHQVSPVYPPAAKHARIQGSVILQALISKEGSIKDLKVISGPRELVDAAIGAVQQWRYRPYVINGEPVEVETIVTVMFQLR